MHTHACVSVHTQKKRLGGLVAYSAQETVSPLVRGKYTVPLNTHMCLYPKNFRISLEKGTIKCPTGLSYQWITSPFAHLHGHQCWCLLYEYRILMWATALAIVDHHTHYFWPNGRHEGRTTIENKAFVARDAGMIGGIWRPNNNGFPFEKIVLCFTWDPFYLARGNASSTNTPSNVLRSSGRSRILIIVVRSTWIN